MDFRTWKLDGGSDSYNADATTQTNNAPNVLSRGIEIASPDMIPTDCL
jgi:hypothetical protein